MTFFQKFVLHNLNSYYTFCAPKHAMLLWLVVVTTAVHVKGASFISLRQNSVTELDSKLKQLSKVIWQTAASLSRTVPILYSGWNMSPLKNAPSHGGSGRPSNTWFLSPRELAPQTASRLVQPFLHSSPV